MAKSLVLRLTTTTSGGGVWKGHALVVSSARERPKSSGISLLVLPELSRSMPLPEYAITVCWAFRLAAAMAP